MSAENKLTKERVLGQVSMDLIIKGGKLLEQKTAQATEASKTVFQMAIDIVTPKAKPLTAEKATQPTGEPPTR